MDKFKLIEDFAEGIISPKNEEYLFKELAVDESLRTELKQVLALNSAVKNNKSLFLVDPGLKAGVFGAIGLELPTAISGAAVGTAMVESGLWSGLGAKFISAATMFVSAVVGSILMYLFLDYNDINLANTGKNTSNKQTSQLVQNDSTINNSNIIKSDNTSDKNTNENKDQSEKVKIVYVPIIKSEEVSKVTELNNQLNDKNQKIENLLQKQNQLENTIVDLQNREAKNLELIENNAKENKARENTTFDLNLNNSKSNLLVNKIEPIPNSQIQNKTDDENSPKMNIPNTNIPKVNPFNSNNSIASKAGFNFEWRGFESWHIPDATVTSQTKAPFNNNLIALTYDCNDWLSVGVDFRQENFYLEFTGYDQNEVFNRYFLMTNSSSFGASARLYPLNYGDFKTMVQVSAGMNELGYIGRTMLGFEYTLIDNISMVGGAEYSLFNYSHQNVRFNSQKVSLNYGIKFSF